MLPEYYLKKNRRTAIMTSCLLLFLITISHTFAEQFHLTDGRSFHGHVFTATSEILGVRLNEEAHLLLPQSMITKTTTTGSRHKSGKTKRLWQYDYTGLSNERFLGIQLGCSVQQLRQDLRRLGKNDHMDKDKYDPRTQQTVYLSESSESDSPMLVANTNQVLYTFWQERLMSATLILRENAKTEYEGFKRALSLLVGDETISNQPPNQKYADYNNLLVTLRYMPNAPPNPTLLLELWHKGLLHASRSTRETTQTHELIKQLKNTTFRNITWNNINLLDALSDVMSRAISNNKHGPFMILLHGDTTWMTPINGNFQDVTVNQILELLAQSTGSTFRAKKDVIILENQSPIQTNASSVPGDEKSQDTASPASLQ